MTAVVRLVCSILGTPICFLLTSTPLTSILFELRLILPDSSWQDWSQSLIKWSSLWGLQRIMIENVILKWGGLQNCIETACSTPGTQLLTSHLLFKFKIQNLNFEFYSISSISSISFIFSEKQNARRHQTYAKHTWKKEMETFGSETVSGDEGIATALRIPDSTKRGVHDQIHIWETNMHFLQHII